MCPILFCRAFILSLISPRRTTLTMVLEFYPSMLNIETYFVEYRIKKDYVLDMNALTILLYHSGLCIHHLGHTTHENRYCTLNKYDYYLLYICSGLLCSICSICLCIILFYKLQYQLFSGYPRCKTSQSYLKYT